MRWRGRFVAPVTGQYTLFGDCDGALSVWVDSIQVIEKTDDERREAWGMIELEAKEAYSLKVEYYHRVGNASNHLSWRGPGFEKRVLLLDGP